MVNHPEGILPSVCVGVVTAEAWLTGHTAISGSSDGGQIKRTLQVLQLETQLFGSSFLKCTRMVIYILFYSTRKYKLKD